MTISLHVETRTGSARALRATGKIPGVVYGPKQPNESIVVDKQTFEKLLREAGESTIISLEGLNGGVEVLIHDVTFDPARGGVAHVDFYAIERGKELTTNVPLHFVGEAPAAKGGATVVKALHEVEVTCRPNVLPSHLDVDLSVLTDADARITVSDLSVPAGVKVENEADAVVATMAAVREEEPETEPAVAAADVPVEGKSGNADAS